MKRLSGSRNRLVLHSFYCINCGKQGIPCWRKKSSISEKGHRKALYCPACRMVINHIEIRTEEEREKFLADWAEGKYKEEAEQSIAYAKEQKK